MMPKIIFLSFLTLLTYLPCILAATCTTERPCTAFTLRAFRNGSAIHERPIHAHGFALWIGKRTTTTCPRYIKECPEFTTAITALYCVDKTGASTECGMSVIVPEGQRLYVDSSDGTIQYTVPGQAFPPGAISEGFQYKPGQNGQPGIFQFIGNSSEGLIACPTHPNRRHCDQVTGRNCGPWSVRAALPWLDQSDCELIGGLSTVTNDAAWQYT